MTFFSTNTIGPNDPTQPQFINAQRAPTTNDKYQQGTQGIYD